MKLLGRNRKYEFSNLQRDLFLYDVEEIISNLPDADEKRLEFAKNFVQQMIEINQKDGGKTILGPIDEKTFVFFVFAIVVEYEYQKFIQGW